MTVLPPAVIKSPPATMSPLGREVRAETLALMPPPSAVQALPFQSAILFAGTPPARVKSPPATKCPFGREVNAKTLPFNPSPTAVQVPEVGLYAATLCAETPPARLNDPPITSKEGRGPNPSGSQIVMA